MKTYLLTLLLASSSYLAKAQYKQEEYQKYPEQKIFPHQAFDSLATKAALAKGQTTIAGVAFTRPRTPWGYKAPLADRIYANHIQVQLFPLTAYHEEWLDLKKKEENLKKNRIVYMSNEAYRYRLTCETNARGEFTFPNMKPGKYLLVGILPWSQTNAYNTYTGSAYNSVGGVTDYYQRQYQTITHSDFLTEVIEVVPGTATQQVKLK